MTIEHTHHLPPSKTRYAKGCRCDDCREAHRIYERNRKRQLARPDGRGKVRVIVPADEARKHLLWLASKGIGVRSLEKATGISKHTFFRIRNGDSKWVNTEYNDTILGLNLFVLKPAGNRHPHKQPNFRAGPRTVRLRNIESDTAVLPDIDLL